MARVAWQPDQNGQYHLIRVKDPKDLVVEDYLLKEKCSRCKMLNTFLCEHDTNVRDRALYSNGQQRGGSITSSNSQVMTTTRMPLKFPQLTRVEDTPRTDRQSVFNVSKQLKQQQQQTDNTQQLNEELSLSINKLLAQQQQGKTNQTEQVESRNTKSNNFNNNSYYNNTTSNTSNNNNNVASNNGGIRKVNNGINQQNKNEPLNVKPKPDRRCTIL